MGWKKIIRTIMLGILIFFLAEAANGKRRDSYALNLGPFFKDERNIEAAGRLSDVRSNNAEMRAFNDFYERELSGSIDRVATDAEGFQLIADFFWGQRDGIILELGALDGVMFSQSKDLHKIFGWKRVLIEGSPFFKDRLRAHSPDAFSFSVCVCNETKFVHFVHSRAVGGILEFMDDKFIRKFHYGLSILPKEKWANYSSNVQQLICLPLSSIIEEVGVTHINAMILDVEGGELNILRTIDWKAVRFDVLIIETEERFRPEGYRNLVRAYIEEQEYIFMYDEGRNSWFRHKHFTPFHRNSTISNEAARFDSPSQILDEFRLPVVAKPVNTSTASAPDDGRTLPRNVWIPKCKKTESLPDTLLKMQQLNPLWKFNLVDCNQQNDFMNKHFANTSTLVAYNLINPDLVAARADVWRYAVLYNFGGLYLDFDASISIPLDSFILSNDSLVLSQERGGAYSNLYNKSHHLSRTDSISRDILPLYNTIVQWMIIAKPNNPFILRTLENLVDLVRLEYLGTSAIISGMHRHLQMQIFLVTGPMLLTASIREVLLFHNGSDNEDRQIRFYQKAGFKEVGAHHRQQRSYMKFIEKAQSSGSHSLRLLVRYK